MTSVATEQLAPGYADVTVERDVGCRLSDGTILRADVYRPAREVSLPVLLMRLPYGKTTAGANWGYAHPGWYASHGYVVAVQDVRGRYASDGEFTPFAHEASDGYESVEWAAGLRGSARRYPGRNSCAGNNGAPPDRSRIRSQFELAPSRAGPNTSFAREEGDGSA